MDKNYGTPILEFIQSLEQYPNLEIKSNTMSSQIFGDYDEMMEILKVEMKNAFLKQEEVVMVMKVINMDLR